MEGQEYVIAPWGTGECETTDVTVELPSRELVVQLEVPTAVLERLAQLSDQLELPVEQVLAERLEKNRARIAVYAAQSADELEQVRAHLGDARDFLSGVEQLDTDDIEAEIDRVWSSTLDSA